MNRPGCDKVLAAGEDFPGTEMVSPDNAVSLEARDLTCSRSGRVLFQDLAFMVSGGRLLQVEGANGSGKTTLLKTLCGFIEPDAGEVIWNGRSVRDYREEYLAGLHYVGHSNGIKLNLSCIENLRVAHALCRRSRTAEWTAVLEQYKLAGYEEVPAHLLSSGQRRRLALARLSVCEATIWILDEPFTSLDESGRAMMKEIFNQHLAAGGIIILTSHDGIAWSKTPVNRICL